MALPSAVDGAGQLSLKFGARPCLIEGWTGGATISWEKHIQQRNRLANELTARGVLPGESLVAYGRNASEWVLARSVANILNAFFVPMNWHLAAPEVAYITENCDAVVVLIDAFFANIWQTARAKETSCFQKVRHVFSWAGPVEGAESLASILEDVERSAAFPQPDFLHSRVMLYTGGTSGKPKAVVQEVLQPNPKVPKKHGTSRDSSDMEALGPRGLNCIHDDNVHVAAAPLYHSAPNAWQKLAMATGATTVLMDKFEVRSFFALVEQHKVKTTFVPPILVKKMCELPEDEFKRFNLSSLQSLTVAGAPCPMQTKEEALRRGLPLYEFYGSSELGINTAFRPEDMLRKRDSCGKIAPGCVLKILDDDGNELPPGQKGILYVQRPIAYHKAQAKVKEAALKKDSSYHTVGDIAYVDEEGFVFICDRQIDMIISGGSNIYPAEIEDVMHRHPMIADVAVFGTPDPDYGERVHAAVQLKEGKVASATDIQLFAKDYLAAFKIPRDISFHTDFPRTPSGKLIKRVLRDVYWGQNKVVVSTPSKL